MRGPLQQRVTITSKGKGKISSHTDTYKKKEKEGRREEKKSSKRKV